MTQIKHPRGQAPPRPSASAQDTTGGKAKAAHNRDKLEGPMLQQIADAKLPEPTREYIFAKPRRWRFDFAWPAQMVALEVEGGTWSGGRHTRGSGYAADCEKYNTATKLGWRVYRAVGDMVKNGQALELITAALTAKGNA
jgi:hypothetical protein